MIVTSNGRRNSVRTDRERLDMLRKEAEALDPKARALLQATLKEMAKKDDRLIGHMAEMRWIRKPVSVEQFIDDPYYLGESSKTLYPKIREDLIDALTGHNYREMILTGSIGYGKTTFLSFAIARMLYELSCLRAPQVVYGLSPGSEIAVALISKSLHLSRTVMKSAVEDKLNLSRYFEDHFPWKSGKDITTFPNNIMMVVGSMNSERVLGMNVIGGAMDEANFMATKGQVITTGIGEKKTVAHFDMAEKTYAGLVRRIKSRFLKSAPDLPGLMVLASSAATIGSFVDRKLEESKKDPTIFARDYATWDVKPSSTFSGEIFKILIGNNSFRNRILKEEEHGEIGWYESQDCRIIDVPEEYRTDFERDLENAIRDIAGIATHAISAFIHRIDKIEACIDTGRRHPFTVEQFTFGESGAFQWDSLCTNGRRKIRGGYEEVVWTPIMRPDKPRHVHIDTSLSGDSTGFAMGYIDRYVDVVRRNEDGEEYVELAPYIVIEFMLRINPPFGEQIFLPDVRTMVYELQEHGFNIASFSCDTYQSAEMLQQIKARGIKGEIISVDRTTTPYDSLKSCIYEERISYYEYEPFVREVKALEYDRLRGKIDHPVAGTKDVSDAVAGVVQGLIQNAHRAPIIVPIQERGDDAENDSWVTGGKVAWGADMPAPKKQDFRGPLPIIIG